MFSISVVKGQDNKLNTLFEVISDSIFSEYSSEIFIEDTVNSKVNYLDYFETEEGCGIPMKLMVEFFANGKRINTPIDISKFIDEKNRNSDSRFKLAIWDIVSYGNIWFSRLTVWDKTIRDRHYSYSLIFIDEKLFCFEKSEWVKC